MWMEGRGSNLTIESYCSFYGSGGRDQKTICDEAWM